MFLFKRFLGLFAGVCGWRSVVMILFVGVGFLLWIRLPLTQGSIWMSPDETANAVSAILWSQTGHFDFAWPLAEQLPWAHPRSFVALPGQGSIAPIGFLGMSFLLGFFYLFFGLGGLLFFTPLFALASLYPLWKLLPQKWPFMGRLFAVLGWMFFPTVLLYANRGAFAQLPLTCFVLWMWWAMRCLKDPWRWIVSAFCLLFVLFIRPVEFFWVLPVFGVVLWSVARESLDWRQFFLFFGLPFCLGFFVGSVLGFYTYGSWFVSGYQLRPFVSEGVSVSGLHSVSAVDVLPFSFHFWHLWWNIKHFLFFICWPWVLLVFGAFLHWIFFGQKSKETIATVFAIGFSSIVLIGFYGNGLYHDHLDPNAVRIGNSFLRYLLPLSLALPLSLGYLLTRVWSLRWLRVVSIFGCLGLLFFGYWTAYLRDDEGILANAREFTRYALIRETAVAQLDPSTCVFSDRSDKIFFPVFCAISPIPNDEQIRYFLDLGGRAALWRHTLTSEEIGLWRDRGFLLVPIFTNTNQTLYHVK